MNQNDITDNTKIENVISSRFSYEEARRLVEYGIQKGWIKPANPFYHLENAKNKTSLDLQRIDNSIV